jgi:site-specific recombinase XerD
VRDVDFERGTIFVRRGKGAKDRYVPIGERALFWVRLYAEIVRPGFVGAEYPDHLFLSSAGTPLCPDWLCRKVRRYLEMAGIDKRGSCHLLRHTVATLMQTSNVAAFASFRTVRDEVPPGDTRLSRPEGSGSSRGEVLVGAGIHQP